MRYLLFVILVIAYSVAKGQTNAFPLYSSGSYSGGSGDHTDIASAQLKLQATSGYIRVPHVSSSSDVSAVYNYESGKNVYWGEPSDQGIYFFRGRRLDIGRAGGQLRLSGGTVAGGLWTNYTDILYLADWDTGNKGFAINMTSGHIGIGTLPSIAKLDINQGGGESGQNLALKVRAGNSSNYFGNTQLSFSYAGGVGYSHSIKTRHNSGSISGNAFDFYVWQPGDGIDAEGSLNVMTLNGDKVGIGTSSPTERLTVNGTIYGKEIRVDLNVPAPDYVFQKDYDLPSLEEVKAHIGQHGHLPEVPSAKEMAEEGINVAQMNMILLKKIEELTLYMLQQQNEIEKLRSEIQKSEP